MEKNEKNEERIAFENSVLELLDEFASVHSDDTVQNQPIGIHRILE